MCPNNRSDLYRSSSDRDVPYKHTRRKETQKYLRQNCYHRIECTETSFLAAFIWKTPEQCCFSYHNSQKAKKDVWCLSKGSDDQQV